MTSYSVAFLSPDPVTMYLSSVEMSQHSTEDDSFDCKRRKTGLHANCNKEMAESYLKDAGTIRRPPGIEKVVLSSANKPLAAVSELKGQDAALVQMQLVLISF
jgi:hypothetical protein